MPTFSTGSGVGDNYAAVLFTFPDVAWFKRCILGAINEMTLDYNWTENGDVGVSFAVEESEKMLETYAMYGFNPFPVGLVLPFGGTTAPLGYLLADGTSYLAADYPELFAVIGYTYGGSGANFFVPDFRNNFVVGSGDTYAPNDKGGFNEITLTTAQLASHSHVADAPTVIDPSHSHVEGNAIPTVVTIGAGAPVASAVPSIGNTAPSLTGISVLAPNINNTGGDSPHENRPPYIAVPYIIYAGR